MHFAIRHPHERTHLAGLESRLLDLRAGSPSAARVAVHADTRAPLPGAWDVQVFHGLGDKGYTLNPLFLQRGRWPRARTAANRLLRALRLPAPFLRPPAHPGRRRGRYEQVNAYGPRFRDRLEEMLEDVEVSRYGHVALNDTKVRADPDGPLLWMPTWDNRKYLGGTLQSSLGPFAHEVALVSEHVPIRLKYHPLTLVHDQAAAGRGELERQPGIEVAPATDDPYELLDGVRGILTDTSSLGFEAYCLGIPVGLARPPGLRYEGMHAELAARVPVFSAGRPDLLAWAEAPDADQDTSWRDDLIYRPAPTRNDAFAQDLRAKATRDD